MKKLQFQLLSCLILASMLFCSCGSGGDGPDNPIIPPVPPVTIANRTVIAYITADNNISTLLNNDLKEMQEGSKNLPADCNLIAFVDMKSQTPYIAKISNGNIEKVRQYENDFYSVSPDSMLSIYQWIIANYPAQEYATVIGGHGTGAVVSNDTIPTGLIKLHAYGWDNYNDNNTGAKWINVPTLATVFSHLPKMTYVFFDCCCMQTAEIAYELRNCTEYIISPVSETHESGAPYKEVVPVLSQPKDIVGQAIIDHYVTYGNFGNSCGVCISCIRTSEMENLLTATRAALTTLYDGTNRLEIPVDHTIYYYRGYETNMIPIHHDMKAVMKKNLSDTDFGTWLQALERAVIYKVRPIPDGSKDLWTTTKSVGGPDINFSSFYDYANPANNYYDDDHYGGISMIVPNVNYDGAIIRGYTSPNVWIKELQWINLVGWNDMGW